MKNKKTFLLSSFFVVLFLLSSCQNKEDQGYSKISPSLKEKLEHSSSVSSTDNFHDIVIVLDKNTTEPPQEIHPEDIKYVARDLVHAVFARVSDALIRELANKETVVSIDDDHLVHTNLFYATKQIGVRDTWDAGYKGKHLGGTSSAIRIAVVDTGIDLNHNDFSGRIADAVDCYNKTCTSVGEKDDHGHGTHVSGIVLGNGASCDTGSDAAYFEFADALTLQGDVTSHFFPAQFNGAVLSDLAVDLTWSGAAGTTSGVFFRTKEDAEEEKASYIAPGLSPGTLAADGPGVGAGEYFSSPPYPISSSASDTLIPYAFSAYTLDTSLVGQIYWAHVKTTVKGWGDALPRTAGVSYESELVAVKSLNADGDATTGDIVRGLEYVSSVAEAKNVVAVNLSFSISGGIQSMVIEEAVHSLVDKGVVAVVSAGNEQESGFYVNSPGSAPSAITVGAVNNLDQVTEYTSLGSPYQGVMKPDVLAPGGSRITKRYIASAKTLDGSLWNHLNDVNLKDPYTLKVGTSQAAPFVTGLVGVMASKHSGAWDFTSSELPKLFKMIICMSSYEVGAGESGTISSGYDRTAVSPGLPERAGGLKDRVEGYGRISVQGAMSAFDTSGMSFAFGDGLGEQKSFIRKVTLSASKEYNYTMDVPSGTDFDLYLFDGTPDDNGEPVLLASSALKNASVERIIDFIPPKDGAYYLVAKWISGTDSSSIDLESERAKPATPTTISNVSVYRDIISKKIIAKWTTNVPTKDVIQYGEDGGMGSEGYLNDYSTAHKFYINIDYGKKYYLRMLSSSKGSSEANISTAITPVYKISTQTGKDALIYDISPDDLPSLDAGGCGTVTTSGQNPSAWYFLLPIMVLLFIRLRLIYPGAPATKGGRTS